MQRSYTHTDTHSIIDTFALIQYSANLFYLFSFNLSYPYSWCKNVLVILDGAGGGGDGRSAPLLLILVPFELQKIQNQFWKALKKWAWVFKVPEILKMSSSPAKMLSKNWTFCIYQYAWRKSYYTRNTPADFEGSLWVLCLRYCYH